MADISFGTSDCGIIFSLGGCFKIISFVIIIKVIDIKNSIKLKIKYFEVVKNIFKLSEKFGDILSVFKFKRKVIPSLGANGFCVVNFISLFSCKIL